MPGIRDRPGRFDLREERDRRETNGLPGRSGLASPKFIRQRAMKRSTGRNSVVVAVVEPKEVVLSIDPRGDALLNFSTVGNAAVSILLSMRALAGPEKMIAQAKLEQAKNHRKHWDAQCHPAPDRACLDPYRVGRLTEISMRCVRCCHGRFDKAGRAGPVGAAPSSARCIASSASTKTAAATRSLARSARLCHVLHSR